MNLDLDREFPCKAAGLIHLSHAGSSPLPRRTVDALQRYALEASTRLNDCYGAWWQRINSARANAAKLLGADAGEIAFVKSTTHGLQIAAHSLAWKPGDVIIVEEYTFPANWYIWKSLEKRHGVRVVLWPERDFGFELEDLEKLLHSHPVRLVSISSASYCTGFRQDVNAIGAMVKNAGALFAIDGIQSLGAFPMDVRRCQADFVSADSHKWLLGPEGIGILYVAPTVMAQMDTAFCGWVGRKDFMKLDDYDLPPDPTARRFEEGAPNYGYLQTVGESFALLNEVDPEERAALVRRNTAILEQAQRELGWRQISPRDERHASGISAFETTGKDPERIAQAMSARKFTCTARRGWLRLAPHFYQTEAEMGRAVAALREVAAGH